MAGKKRNPPTAAEIVDWFRTLPVPVCAAVLDIVQSDTRLVVKVFNAENEKALRVRKPKPEAEKA